MVYNIKHYNGDPLVSVSDGTLDTSTTSISLVGKNVVNFGLALNENFIALMQHFASSSPPPNPLQGTLWFYTVDSILKVFDGQKWLSVPLPFDGNAGTAIIAISNVNSVVAVLSCGEIVSVASHQSISHASLPTTVNIADVTYQFASRFLNGLLPGINLAGDTNNYQFLGNASSANILSTARSIEFDGSFHGLGSFDGSNDIVITSTLANVFNVNIDNTQYYSKVLMSSNGLVLDANVIIDTDVTNALGYTPASSVVIIGDVSGISVSNGNVFTMNVAINNSNVTAGIYNTVTVDKRGIIQYGKLDYPIPIYGIILWNSLLVPNNWALCDGTTVSTPSGLFTTPNLTANFIGSTKYIIRVS